MANALSSFTGNQGNNTAPVNIKPFGDILKLYFQDSNKYAGLLTLPVLTKILDEFVVKFDATLVASKSQLSRTSGRKATKRDSSRECCVRITVYGLKREKSAVSNLLSEAALYLQQPSAAECDREVEYCNPHYLLRPGSQMPMLEELSISSDFRNQTAPDALDEANKSRFMRIFDSAADFKITSRVISSPRLRSTLKGYVTTHH